MLEDAAGVSGPGGRCHGGMRERCGFTGPEPGGAVFCCRAHRRRASPLTCLAICFLVLSYNLLGGFLFLALEGNPGQEETAVAAVKPNLSQAQGAGRELRTRTVERLWAITEDLNILYKENWTKLAAKELMDFQKVLMKSMGGGGGERGARGDDYHWTFSTSFLYALTLITTIGHGDVAPRSAAGRAVAVLYSCVGVPLVLLYLSALGGALARRARLLYARARPPRRPPAPAQEKTTPFQAALNLATLPRAPCPAPRAVPAPLSVLLLALYMALGALVFRETEHWSLLDGAYFAFSALATIGLGELRPGRRAASPAAEDVAIGVCCLYILVGIVVVAMCFNLIQEDLGGALRGAALCAGGRVREAPPPAKEELVAMSVVS
ncbi:potassium channel subfamily K member 16 [Plutella xylostella]|uniref:potassium channel subfamily K member 16 n=1 Tax=Plutella xylostella TaxID=51655 RepID=UPI002032D65F|nr:potassium channel subfamily K member 16 [Plutella xylostella]